VFTKDAKTNGKSPVSVVTCALAKHPLDELIVPLALKPSTVGKFIVNDVGEQFCLVGMPSAPARPPPPQPASAVTVSSQQHGRTQEISYVFTLTKK
jgi:hypothetical protein